MTRKDWPVFSVAMLLLLLSGVLAAVTIVPVGTAATYTVTVMTQRSSYSATELVNVTGAVSPSPGPYQAVSFSVTNPASTTIPLAGTATIDPTTGDFTFTFTTGGIYFSVSGTYTLRAEYDGFYGSTTFSYSPTSTSTSSSETTTSSTQSSVSTTTSESSTSVVSQSSTTSSTSSTASTSSSATSKSSTSASISTTSSAIPEFPVQLAFVAIFTVFVVTAYILIRNKTLSSARALPQMSNKNAFV